MLILNSFTLFCALIPLSLAAPNLSQQRDSEQIQRRQLTRAKLVELEARSPARRAAPSGAPSPAPMGTLYTLSGAQRVLLSAGRYDLAAWGASGGSARGFGGPEIAGGLAANINVTISLGMPTDMNLIVGAPGGTVYPRSGGGGGGGGSFVYTTSGVAVLVAGGGGADNGGAVAASGSTSGNAGRGPGGAGGVNGFGGQGTAPSNTPDTTAAGGGAGFFGPGQPSSMPSSGRSQPDFSGGAPGDPLASAPGAPPNINGAGGVGGGGGGSAFAGGGGGGYSGGGSGANGQGASGGGGGSYADSSYRVANIAPAVTTTWQGSGQIYIFGPY